MRELAIEHVSSGGLAVVRMSGAAPGRGTLSGSLVGAPRELSMKHAGATSMDLSGLSDEELIARIRQGPEEEVGALYDALYLRYYRKVAGWCLRVCGDRERASDLAQEVFLRVHDRLDSFRLESRFSTWLYTVTRRVAINRGKSERLRQAASLDAVSLPEPADPAPDAGEVAERRQIAGELRRAMERDLEPTEARVLYLHFVDGMTLAAITSLLGLENKSGAKAYIVSGKRKLERRFGRWLARQGEPRVGRNKEGES